MNKIGFECVICKEPLWQNPTTESGQVSSGLNREIKTTDVVPLARNHEFHSECIEKWTEEIPRCPLDRRFITTLPRSSIHLHKALLKSLEDNQIDDVREILSTGVLDPSQLESPLAVSLIHKQWDVSAELLRLGATTQNRDRQSIVGCMYLCGVGVEQNYPRALLWLQKSADQGFAIAQNNLGCMYLNGVGVEQNYQEAMRWYQKSADQGHAIAQNSVGWMYQNGLGVEQNYQEAMRWYQKSADQRHPDAQNNLGWMYMDGLGVEQNYQEAVRWYQKSADQGYATAQNNLGWMYLNGFGVGQSYQEALVWFHKAADQGFAGAQNNVRLMYQKIL